MQDFFERLIPFEKVLELRNTLKDKKIVFTNGCFDILHRGHVSYLSEAKSLGDILWLGLNSDSSVKKLKGESRPINPEEDRAAVLLALRFVDYVTLFSQDTPVELLHLMRPHIHVKGGDYKKEDLPEYPVVKQYGGDVFILSFVEGKSTSSIIQKARGG